MYFIHSNFLVEEDYSLYHPLGRVYKPKGCIDTLIRFVRQPNNSTLMFKANEWNKPTNSFYIDNIKFRFVHFFGLFYNREAYLY